jgi:hypothetical protein
MKPVIQIFGESFFYDRMSHKAHTYERFVPEHLLAYQISGQTQIYLQREEIVLAEGYILLSRGNQFAKSIKIPAKDKTYQCISVLLTNQHLRQFALDNHIVCDEPYSGSKNILLQPNVSWQIISAPFYRTINLGKA